MRGRPDFVSGSFRAHQVLESAIEATGSLDCALATEG